MRSYLCLCAFIIMFFNVNAQSFDYNHESNWKETPEKHTVNNDFEASSAVGILDDRSIEYKMEAKEVALYITYHRIIKITDDKGIEMFNKIYIPVGASTITELKARTVLSNGKVITVPSDKIKEMEEDGVVYKLFAMEGVEKGAEIEYMYTAKRPVSFFGYEVFQSASTPYQKAVFTLSFPVHLLFDAKAFNGFKISSDSIIGEKRVIAGYDENIPEVEEEKYSVREPFLKRVEYKLSYNLSSNPDVRLYTWKEFAKRAYAMYTTTSSKDEKPIASLFAATKAGSANTLEERILAIEDYIKNTINIDKNLIGEDAGAIDKIVKRKSSDNQGIIRLFASLFDKAGITYQIVFAGRRDEAPLDEEIENWNRIDETVFYFPDTKKYLAPTSIELRYPYIPFYWTGTKGLFLKGATIGTFKSAIGVFGQIEMLPADNHSIDMEVSVKFDESIDTLLINSKQIFRGYGAAGFRPIYAFLPKDKQDEANMEIIKSASKSTDISNIKVENPELFNYSTNKPLFISAEIKSTDMLEKAGNKILLKIGEIIGPQEQMYQEKPRRLPIELPYPHHLDRKITLQIPTGYSVKNLKDLNKAIEHKDGEEITMGFTSTFKQDGNLVTIDVKESYNKMTYPLSQFEEYRKIINAAADFNKIILVLEKSN